MPTPPATAAADARLLAGMRSRDPRALDEAYRAYGALVHGVALRVVRDAHTAEEITQDVFVYAWQHVERHDMARGTVAAWLLTLARSRGIDRLRARQSQDRRVEGLAQEVAAIEPLPQADALTDLVAGDEARRVRAALATLPREQREALEIAYFEGLSHSETAARLGAPLGTVKTRIRQGMLRLRSALDSPLPDDR